MAHAATRTVRARWALLFLVTACSLEESGEPLYVAAPNEFRDPITLDLAVSRDFDEGTRRAVRDAIAEWQRALPFAHITVMEVDGADANVIPLPAATSGPSVWGPASGGRLTLSVEDRGNAQCTQSGVGHALAFALGMRQALDAYPNDAEPTASEFAITRAHNGCSTRVLAVDGKWLASWRNYQR